MKKTITILTVLLVLCSTLLFAGGKADPMIGPNVSANGTGVVTLTPDTATISFAVETTDEQASVASQENAKIMTSVYDVLANRGIAKEDISTNGYNVYQQSRWNSEKDRTEYLDYKVSNNVTITVHAIDTVGDIIDAVLLTGVNRLNDVNFYAKDTQSAYDEARKLAVQEAMSTAKILAEGAGCELGMILSISENSGYTPVYGNFAMARKESTTADYATPIAPGSTDVTVSVFLTAALD